MSERPTPIMDAALSEWNATMRSVGDAGKILERRLAEASAKQLWCIYFDVSKRKAKA